VKRLKLKGANVVETGDLLVWAALPDAKAKSLAGAAQRAVAVARENLKFDKDDTLFTGKLTVYVFAEHADLKLFIRQIEQRRPEADASTQSLRGNQPHVAVSPDAGTKLGESQAMEAAATWSAAAVLNRRIGVAGDSPLPQWLQIGYGRACFIRGESATKQVALRQKIRSVVAAKGKNAVTAKDIWGDAKLADRDVAAGSLVEFLAFGPYAEKFVAFARSTKPPADSDAAPNMDEALKTLELTADQLDQAWKTWVVKGK
jgi:hypothetical protein